MTSHNKTARMRRATADRLLAEATERVRQINADPSYCFTVSRMVVFGSYANSDRETLGDLDIAVQLVPRYDKDDPHWDVARARYRGYDFLVCRNWPMEEVMRKIRNRNAYISVHRIGRTPEQDGIIFSDRTIEIDLGVVE